MMPVSGVWRRKRAIRMPHGRSRPTSSDTDGPSTPTRRIAGLFLALFLVIGVPAGVRAGREAAAEKIRRFYGSLLGMMRDGPSLGFSGRYQRISPVIAETFDLTYMARVSVGRYWDRTPKAEQQEIIDAFGSYVTATYASRFSSYSGQQFQVLSEQPYRAAMIVDSRILRATGQSVVVKYLMRGNGGDWRIADIYLDGTISELATRRAEFSAVIQRHGVGGLIEKLRQRSEQLSGNTPR